MFRNKFEQVNVVTMVIRFARANGAGPGNVTSYRFLLVRSEERFETCISQHGEQRFLVNNLGAKTIHHADRPRPARVEVLADFLAKHFSNTKKRK